MKTNIIKILLSYHCKHTTKPLSKLSTDRTRITPHHIPFSISSVCTESCGNTCCLLTKWHDKRETPCWEIRSQTLFPHIVCRCFICDFTCSSRWVDKWYLGQLLLWQLFPLPTPHPSNHPNMVASSTNMGYRTVWQHWNHTMETSFSWSQAWLLI